MLLLPDAGTIASSYLAVWFDLRVHSYIVAFDSGFAPNPFHGVCTLACCKPVIRRHAKVGDLVVGLSRRSERVVFAMQVVRRVGFAEYWSDPAYVSKRPAWRTGRAIEECGDNIYEPQPGGGFRQLPSWHSNQDGSENTWMMRHDLGGGSVLIAERFVYFGADAPAVPDDLRFLGTGRGHRSRVSADEVRHVQRWLEQLPTGVVGRPQLWPVDDASWASAGSCVDRDAGGAVR